MCEEREIRRRADEGLAVPEAGPGARNLERCRLFFSALRSEGAP